MAPRRKDPAAQQHAPRGPNPSKSLGWYKQVTSLPADPQFIDLSNQAKLLYWFAYSHSAEHMAEGAIGLRALRMLAGLIDGCDVDATLQELVAAELFELHEGGYLIKRFSDEQPANAQIERERRAAAERQARFRQGRLSDGDGVSNAVTNAVSNGEQPALVTVPESEAETDAEETKSPPMRAAQSKSKKTAGKDSTTTTAPGVVVDGRITERYALRFGKPDRRVLRTLGACQEQDGVGLVLEAIDAAVGADMQSPPDRYIRGILDNWRVEGHESSSTAPGSARAQTLQRLGVPV